MNLPKTVSAKIKFISHFCYTYVVVTTFFTLFNFAFIQDNGLEFLATALTWVVIGYLIQNTRKSSSYWLAVIFFVLKLAGPLYVFSSIYISEGLNGIIAYISPSNNPELASVSIIFVPMLVCVATSLYFLSTKEVRHGYI